MNAPEKFYTDENGLFPMLRHHCDSDIEYVRTDAFIDKACTWLKDRAERFAVNTPVCDYYDYKQAVEDFKNYMKGE